MFCSFQPSSKKRVLIEQKGRMGKSQLEFNISPKILDIWCKKGPTFKKEQKCYVTVRQSANNHSSDGRATYKTVGFFSGCSNARVDYCGPLH